MLARPDRVISALGVLGWQVLLPPSPPGTHHTYKQILISVGRNLHIGIMFEPPFLHPIKASYSKYLLSQLTFIEQLLYTICSTMCFHFL